MLHLLWNTTTKKKLLIPLLILTSFTLAKVFMRSSKQTVAIVSRDDDVLALPGVSSHPDVVDNGSAAIKSKWSPLETRKEGNVAEELAVLGRIESERRLETPLNPDVFQGVRPTDKLDKEIDGMAVEALPYLENFRNPCWWEDLPSDRPYALNFFHRTGRDVYKKYFTPWSLVTRRSYKEGVRRRLRCLPLVYQVGIAKAGTTDLYFSLAQHPLMQLGGYKEPHYWSLFRFRGWKPSSTEPSVPLKDYVDLYDEAATKIDQLVQVNSTYHPAVTIDASVYPVYDFRLWEYLPVNKGLDEPKYIAADFLKMLVPKAKIIAIVREPVSRMYSHFKHFTDSRRATAKLFHEATARSVANMKDCLQAHSSRYCVYQCHKFGDGLKLNGGNLVDLASGMYYPLFKDWLDVFGWEQLKIVRLEDHERDPEGVTSDIFHFLELPAFRIQKGAIRNKSRGRSPMLPETKRLLQEFYAPFNKMMADFMQNEDFNYPYPVP